MSFSLFLALRWCRQELLNTDFARKLSSKIQKYGTKKLYGGDWGCEGTMLVE